MPSFKKGKYTAAQTQEIRMRAFEAIGSSTQAMTIEEIKNADLCLAEVTSQKIAQVLGGLTDAGFVVKIKNKAGRMTYMSIETANRYKQNCTGGKE
jgi:hypothetical protein